MIGGIIILLAAILALIEKPHLFKRPFQTEKIVIIVIILGTGIAAIIKDRVEANEQEETASIINKSKKTIDSLKVNSDIQKELIIHQTLLIDSLRFEERMAALQNQDSLKAYHYKTTAILARYGLKVDTLRGEVSKIDVKNQQPHLALFGTKGLGFKLAMVSDTLHVNGWVINDGTGIAYGVHLETQLFFVLDTILYRYKWRPEVQRDDYDIAPNRAVTVHHPWVASRFLYDKITVLVLVMTGHYYTDYQRKKTQNIRLGVTYNENNFAPIIVNIDSLIKSVKFADFLYK